MRWAGYDEIKKARQEESKDTIEGVRRERRGLEAPSRKVTTWLTEHRRI